MKHRKWMTRVSLIALAASVSACVSGDFCDVVGAEIKFEAATSAQVVATDREPAESLAAQNAYWLEHCR